MRRPWPLLGHAVGVHPLVSLFALLAFAELFGLWGALFAAPAVGFAQALATAFWRQWRSNHPEQYPENAGAQPAGAGFLAQANGAGQAPELTLTQKIRVPAGVPLPPERDVMPGLLGTVAAAPNPSRIPSDGAAISVVSSSELVRMRAHGPRIERAWTTPMWRWRETEESSWSLTRMTASLRRQTNRLLQEPC
jgi:hypothetical protein